ncbi:MAG: hypothetical protein NTV61_02580 [Candidatus Bathyarchaeota archaeon]|nr:hypothetical protein [Candidatus Bathyarchaeota archaeon]
MEENECDKGNKEKESIWEDCSGFLPSDFEEILRLMRGDARKRFRRLGIVP